MLTFDEAITAFLLYKSSWLNGWLASGGWLAAGLQLASVWLAAA